MEYKLCIIAPFAAMAQLAEEVIREGQNEWHSTIEISLGDSLAGVNQARLAIEQGTEVFISRGGTALAIADQIPSIPVVQVQVTAFDILRAIKKSGITPDKLGVTGFRNVIYECEMLADILDFPVQAIPLDSREETAAKIALAATKGILGIVGDTNSVILAKNLGLGGSVIESGKDAIYKAIKEAERIAEIRRQEQERTELLRTIVNSSTDGIVAVDKNGRITYFNPAASSIFHTSQAKAIGQPVESIIPNTRLPLILTSGTAEIGEVQYIGQKILATKRIPIIVKNKSVGAIANFQDVTQLQHFEQSIRQKLHAKGLVAKIDLDQIIGASPAINEVKRQVRRYAPSSSTVLISGESGTGKEMFAQSIHKLSFRDKNPFVAINCAALPETLLESELMGYEEGAFTGAKKGGKTGLFELAHGGSIFLDEIGELPLSLQARLLRVLQEKEVMRLGGHTIIPIDIRVIAATNQNLAQLVAERKFRADLYYRLNILKLHLPPLRSRREDIVLLASHFLAKLSDSAQKTKQLSPEALALLQTHPWPGNIRELSNILERAVLLSDSPKITAAEMKRTIDTDLEYTSLSVEKQSSTSPLTDCGELDRAEKEIIGQVLQEENFNYTRAAKRLGISRSTLWRKMQKQ